MTFTTTLTIEHSTADTVRRPPLPTAEDFRDFIEKHVEATGEGGFGTVLIFGSLEPRSNLPRYWENHSKWEAEGAHEAARKASAKWRGKLVTLDFDWDNRDADEAGRERFEYRNGKLVAEYEQQLVLVKK